MNNHSNKQLFAKRFKTESHNINADTLQNQHNEINRMKVEQNRKLPILASKKTFFQKQYNKLNMINEQDSPFLNKNQKMIMSKRLSTSVSRTKQIQILKAQKIYQSLCQPMIFIGQSPQKKTNFSHINQSQLQCYDKARLFYHEMQANKKTKDVQQLLNLINMLKIFNNFINKIDDMLALILFKKSKIIQFQPKQTIYIQNEQQNSAFILLWGQVKIKQIYRNKIKYILPGDSLCEDAILEEDRSKRKYFSQVQTMKGNMIAKQTAKAQLKCGLLEITKQSYLQITQKFRENGQKQKVMIFQKLLHNGLIKKSKFYC